VEAVAAGAVEDGEEKRDGQHKLLRDGKDGGKADGGQ
jgi:hypothetical protein